MVIVVLSAGVMAALARARGAATFPRTHCGVDQGCRGLDVKAEGSIKVRMRRPSFVFDPFGTSDAIDASS